MDFWPSYHSSSFCDRTAHLTSLRISSYSLSVSSTLDFLIVDSWDIYLKQPLGPLVALDIRLHTRNWILSRKFPFFPYILPSKLFLGLLFFVLNACVSLIDWLWSMLFKSMRVLMFGRTLWLNPSMLWMSRMITRFVSLCFVFLAMCSQRTYEQHLLIFLFPFSHSGLYAHTCVRVPSRLLLFYSALDSVVPARLDRRWPSGTFLCGWICSAKGWVWRLGPQDVYPSRCQEEVATYPEVGIYQGKGKAIQSTLIK